MDQEQNQPSSGRGRKPKFTPKAQPPSRSRRSIIPRKEDDKDNPENEAAQAEKLMNKFTANLRPKVPKTEKNDHPKQVAFDPGAASETSIREFGVRRSERVSSSSSLEVKDAFDYEVDDNGMMVIPSPSVVTKDGMMQHPSEVSDELTTEGKKVQEEPWDYSSYYPTILPWKRPNSGDPELLDEDEFGSTADNMEYDENTVNTAGELGLLEDCDRERMLFFQLPSKLPIIKRSAGSKGKEKAESPTISENAAAMNRYGNLEELSGGYMGKMLVYKSGAVKLKLGDVLFDVSPGVDCMVAQDVMAMNTASKHCCSFGEIGKRAVVTPDIDFLLNQ